MLTSNELSKIGLEELCDDAFEYFFGDVLRKSSKALYDGGDEAFDNAASNLFLQV